MAVMANSDIAAGWDILFLEAGIAVVIGMNVFGQGLLN